jgi:hypothetical protein
MIIFIEIIGAIFITIATALIGFIAYDIIKEVIKR